MLTTEMSSIIAAAQAGDTIVVRHAGGRPTTYKVRSVGGKKARELKLEGRRGAMRVLVDGGDQIWIREASARASDGSAHRRVTSVLAVTQQIEPVSGRDWLREKAIAEAGIPPGYGIELHPRGFQAMAGSEPAGPAQPSAYVAVCNAWSHWADGADARAGETALRARLPHGYDIMTTGDGSYTRHLAVLDEPTRPVVSPCTRAIAVDAVVDAWTHAKGRLESDLSRHRTTAIDRDVAKADAARCRRALRQIREIAKGTEPTGEELAHGEMPEQVVAEVGHALRVESKGRSATTRIDLWDASPSINRIAAAIHANAHGKDPTP